MLTKSGLARKLVGIKTVRSLLLIIAAIGLMVSAAPVQAEPMGPGAGSVVDPALESYVPTVGLKGKLLIVGSDTMHQLMSRIGSEFKKWYPGVTISVETEGSSAGFVPFLEWSSAGGATGPAESGMLLAYSKPLQETEAKEFVAKVGYRPMEFHVALGAVAVYLHESNPLRELTLEQLDAMFGTSRKRGMPTDITKWGQVGLRGNWEQKPIHLYGRDKRSGTRRLFKLEALLDGEFKTEIQEEPGANSLVLAVSNDPQAVGYAGILYKEYSSVKVIALAEKAGKPFITPNAESVRRGVYPLRRELYLYVNKAPNQPMSPLVREFLKLAHSREGQEMVVASGFYTLPSSLLSQNLAMLSNRPDAK